MRTIEDDEDEDEDEEDDDDDDDTPRKYPARAQRRAPRSTN